MFKIDYIESLWVFMNRLFILYENIRLEPGAPFCYKTKTECVVLLTRHRKLQLFFILE